MKNVIIGILLIVSVALGGLLIQKNHNAALAEAKLAEAQKTLADLQSGISERDAQATRLREKLDSSLAESAANAGTAAQLSVALTNRVEAVEKTNAKPANPLAEMFKNPEMREMIKKQQQTMFASMVEKNYSDFIKTQQLSPEQASALKELIAKKMAVGTDMGMEMMGGEMTAEQRADLMKQAKASTDAAAEEIKHLLGADVAATYETYEKSVPDRMAVSAFNDQLTQELALNSEQKQQLTDGMTQERQDFKFTTDFNNQSDFSQDFTTRFTEDNMNTFFQEQDQLNQKYLTRAQTILSADQYTAYQKSLKTQQDMARMGMKMAVQMFGPKK